MAAARKDGNHACVKWLLVRHTGECACSTRMRVPEGSATVLEQRTSLCSDCVNAECTRRVPGVGTEAESPERNSDINMVYLKEMKS